MKKYKEILVDAPWTYDNAQQNDPKRGGITYPVMSMKALHDLPIHKAMEDDSIMFFWVTFPKLVDSYYEEYNPLSIIDSWGFRPVTAAFVWIKENKSGGYYSGMGRYTNSNAEICLVCRRGKGLPRLAKNVKQLIFAPIGEHSAKPQEQYNRIHALYGDVPRIELFARKQNPPPNGWDAVGLDYNNQDIREWIKQYE